VSSSITSSDDGSYVDVFVPIAFRRFGGRKVIVSPLMVSQCCPTAARRPTRL
jgi:hypothetical protein